MKHKISITFILIGMIFIGFFCNKEIKASTIDDAVLNLHLDSNLTDSSGNNSLVTPKGDPKYVQGVNKNGIQISNVVNSEPSKMGEDYYSITNNENLNVEHNNFSIGFWYKSSGGSNNGAAIITNKDYSTGNNVGFAIGQFESAIRINFTTQDSSRKDIYSLEVNDDRWHYVFVNFDRKTNISAYIDGEKKGSIKISDDIGKSIGSNNIMIGADINGNSALKNSNIDELKVYNRVLSNDEITELAKEYTPPITDEVLVELHSKMQELKDKINSLTLTESQVLFLAQTLNTAEELEKKANNENDILDIIRKLDLALESLNNPTDLDLMFNIFSDTHITTAENKYFNQALDDIKYLSPDSKATLFNGDNNDDGSEAQYANFYNLLTENNVVNPLLILGNHEARWQTDHQVYKDRYLKWNSQYMGNTPENQLYWHRKINGYHFIGLNTELDLKDNAYISKEQITWLKKELLVAQNDNKPIFIQIHQTFKGTGEHVIEDTIYNEAQYPEDFSEKDFDCEEALKDTLKEFSNIVIFTGHIHNGPDLLKVYKKDYGHVVDLPSFSYASYGNPSTAMAYHVQVKGTDVKLKLRDYKNNKWLPENEVSFNVNESSKDFYRK